MYVVCLDSFLHAGEGEKLDGCVVILGVNLLRIYYFYYSRNVENAQNVYRFDLLDVYLNQEPPPTTSTTTMFEKVASSKCNFWPNRGVDFTPQL
jgi:hypothetical protein